VLVIATGHNYDADWDSDGTGHWHNCLNGCGARSDVNTHIGGAAATCTAPQLCTVCDYEVAPANGHTWDETAYITDSADHWYKCSVCNAPNPLTVEAHDPGAAATCTTDQVCTICDYIIAARAHSWNLDLSFDEDGHWRECANCADKKDEDDHDYDEGEEVPATCTEGAYIPYTCDCGYSYNESTGGSPAGLGHAYSSWSIVGGGSKFAEHSCTRAGCTEHEEKEIILKITPSYSSTKGYSVRDTNSLQLFGAITDPTPMSGTLVWSTSDTSKATIASDGTISFFDVGEVTITLTLAGTDATAAFTFDIFQSNSFTSFWARLWEWIMSIINFIINLFTF